MSSKRLRTWTTLPSCTKGGQRGCERDPCRSLRSSEGRNPPESTGSGATEPQSTMRGKGGCRDPPARPHGIHTGSTAAPSDPANTNEMGLHLSPRDVWGAHRDGEGGWEGRGIPA